MPQLKNMTIHFNDKTKLDLRFEQQVSDAVTQATELRKAMESETLSLEIEGRLIVIPMRSVKYIQLEPAPEGLPKGVIRGAKVVG